MRLFYTIFLTFIFLYGNQIPNQLTEKKLSPKTRGSHSTGLPAPEFVLMEESISIPFGIDPAFPVPYVEVILDDGKPYRFAFDTGNSGTFFIRSEFVEHLGLPVIGKAIMGDGTGKNQRAADLIKLSSLKIGKMEFNNVIGVSGEVIAEHTREVPESFVGILGLGLAKNLVVTLDYPTMELRFTSNHLDATMNNTVKADFSMGIAKIDADLCGTVDSYLVDSGHRNSISLPASKAELYPVSGNLEKLPSLATITNIYTRSQAILDGNLFLAGNKVENPLVAFSEGPPLQLIGYGILKNFEVSLDQTRGLVRFARK